MDMNINFDSVRDNANPLKRPTSPFQRPAHKSSTFLGSVSGSTQTRPGLAVGQAAPVTPTNTSLPKTPPYNTTPEMPPSLVAKQPARRILRAITTNTNAMYAKMSYADHMAEMRKSVNPMTIFSSRIPSAEWSALFKHCKQKYNGFRNFSDVIAMPITERIPMVYGPVIDIRCDGKHIEFPMFVMPWMGFSVCEGSKKPGLVRQDIDARLLEGVQRLADYLKTSLSVMDPFPLRIAGIDAASFGLDVDTIIAAERLGLAQTAEPLFEFWAEWMKTHSISDIGFNTLEVIAVRMAAQFRCKLFHVVIDKLVFDYLEQKMPEPTVYQFRCWMLDHPKMSECFDARMQYIEAYGRP